MIYAVIDTNVFVSALMGQTKYKSATMKVMEYISNGDVIPLYNEEILNEYEDVLYRPKFKLHPETVSDMVNKIRDVGISYDSIESGEVFVDMDDAIFFEVAFSHYQNESDNDTYLVTGNKKHFPKVNFVVTPREFVVIMEGSV